MQIYGRTQVMTDHTYADALNLLSNLGFDGVEVCLEHPDLAPAELTADKAGDVRNQLAELGMTCSVSYHRNYIYNNRLFDETLKAIRLTPAFGTDIFIISGTFSKDHPDAWEKKIERTRELVRTAEECGVIIAQEFEPDFICGTTADLHRMFEEIPSDNLQANLDLGHVFLCDPDPMGAIASLKSKVCHVHIENMAKGIHRHLPLWEGDMDLKQYITVLKAIGFDGPVALDLYNEKYEDIGKESVAFLQNLLKD